MIPLGGLGEFGMNCMALRWQDDIIVIDAGLMFPEEELLGVDIVVPDITYLIENRDKVSAILLTHGHEDHIGGLPWILSELNVPVYGTEFTLALCRRQARRTPPPRRRRPDRDAARQALHARAVPRHAHPRHALARRLRRPRHPHARRRRSSTPATSKSTCPPRRQAFDLQSFAELGKNGVLLLLQDSTNVDRRGWTPGEKAVRPRLDEIFAQHQKRLFFTCFSSSIHRIGLAMELAHKHGRKVAAHRPLHG